MGPNEGRGLARFWINGGGTIRIVGMLGREGVIKVEQTKDRKEQAWSLGLGDQIAMIFSGSLNLFRGIKKLKSIYAHFQSRYPALFKGRWNARFFGAWNSNIQQELFDMHASGSIIETFWTRHTAEYGNGEPIHHIYTLKEEESNRISGTIAAAGLEDGLKKRIQSDVLLWNYLDTRFAVYWLYLLETYTYKEKPEIQERFPLLPTKRHWRKCAVDSGSRTFSNEKEFGVALGRMAKDFKEKKIQPLKIYMSPKSSTRMKMFSFLPYPASTENIREFFEYYQAMDVQNGVIRMTEFDEKNKQAKFKIQTSGIRDFYSYLDLDLDVLRDEIDYLKERKEKAEVSLDGYGHSLFENALGEHQLINIYKVDRARYEAWVARRAKPLQAVDSEVHRQSLDDAITYLETLEDHFALAKWRHETAMGALEELADISKDEQISLRFADAEELPYGKDSEKRNTALCLEPTEKWGQRMDRYLKGTLGSGGFHIGMLSHLSHIFQPVEVIKMIYSNKMEVFKKGGFAIVE